MAYNNYFPATYQPMYYPQQQTQPTSLIWVSGISEAQSYPVAPNNAVALWDSSSPAIYLKQTDASGRPSLKIFDIVERSNDVSSKGNKDVEYATKNDLAALGTLLDGFKAEIDSIKGDIYGIAGKRRKKEVTEDE